MRRFFLEGRQFSPIYSTCSPGKSNIMTARETLSIGQEGASLPMTSLAMNVVEYLQENREATKEAFVRAIFGTFIGGLIIVLILLYAGAPVV